VIDVNGQQIDGPVSAVMDLKDLSAKWKAFGWQILEMEGNDLEEVIRTLKLAKGLTNREQPILILMKTEMGFGVDFMMGSHKWHGIAPNDEDLANALAQLPETIGDY
jgi:transketolase